MKISVFIIPVFCCLGLVKNPAFATDERSYGQGEIVAQESNVMAEWDLKSVPGYKEPSTISETSINEKNIENRIGRSLQTSESAGLIQDTYNQRSRFDLDTDQDSLFTDADKIIKNPEKILKVKAQTQILGVGKTRHNCIKGYDLMERKCRWSKVAVKVGVRTEYKNYTYNMSWSSLWSDYLHHLNDPTYKSLVWLRGVWSTDHPGAYVNGQKSTVMDNQILLFSKLYTGRDAVSGSVVKIDTNKIVWLELLEKHGALESFQTDTQNRGQGWLESVENHGPWDNFSKWQVNNYSGASLSSPQYLKYKVTIGNDIAVYELQDRNNCDDLEGQVDTGACEYSSKRCVEGAETRLIEGTPVYSKCWSEEAVYQCRTQEEDQCADFSKKGCLQIGSRCLTYMEKGHCVKWQQTYECTSGKRQSNITNLSGKKPFCLDGHCVDQTWDGSVDMVDALAKLAIFKEMQKGLDANMGVVFKGRDLGCSRVPTGFKDCCKIKGWGKDIHLASCSPEEEDLGEQRKLGKCLFIGTYCTDKVLGVCTRKKTTFCCYPSKLSKIINVQGKNQLGLSFGNAENPECGGLTLDQISRVDFSQLDLSELLSEMMANLKTPNTTNLGKDIKKSMANKTYMLNDKKKKITQGKAHGNF